MSRLLIALAVLSAAAPSALPLDNSDLNGPYHLVYLGIEAPSGTATQAVNAGGTAVFDGAGNYTVQAQVGLNNLPPVPATASGTYSVDPGGFVTLTNPIDPTLTINGRLGAGGAALLGAGTEAQNQYDILIAVPASTAASDATLSGRYTGASLFLPAGNDASARTAIVNLEPNGAGGFNALGLDGHAADQGDTPISTTIPGATYQINADGTGTLNLGTATPLFQGAKGVFVSPDGEMLLGFSTESGGRDVFVAVRNGSGLSTASFAGNYWVVDLIRDPNIGGYQAAVGGLRSSGSGIVSIAQRMNIGGPLDFGGVNTYGLSSDGTGFLRGSSEPGVVNFAVGGGSAAALALEGANQAVPPQSFIGAQVFQTLLSYNVHGLTFGIRMPDISGSDPFVSPLGVLNGASFAPATAPAAPGTLMTAFGSGVAPTPAGATSAPWPTQLNGVDIDFAGTPAPVFFVNANQANFQVPFSAGGSSAQITLTNNGTAADAVGVPVAATSPAIFSLQQTGFGPGAILDTNFNVVSESNPVPLGGVVQIFATGLGAVNPAVGDGEAAPSVEPFARVVDPELQVLFDGEAGTILFAGAAPGFIGLYQINVQLPNVGFVGAAVPVQVVTSNAFSDFVDIAVGL